MNVLAFCDVINNNIHPFGVMLERQITFWIGQPDIL